MDTSDEPSSIPIVRDTTFSRSVADRGVVLSLGRDVEFAFLQIGPTVDRVSDHDEGEQLKLTPIMTEVTRVRMAWVGAFDFAMQIVQRAIVEDRINNELLMKSLRDIIDQEDKKDLALGDEN